MNMGDAWRRLKDRVKAKRTQKGEVARPAKIGNELTVQRLSADVSGKAQKYTRIGPREFVPVTPPSDDALSIEVIKTACQKHFAHCTKDDTVCDILVGEQGPSCHTMAQIQDLKVIYFRVIPRAEAGELLGDDNDTMDLPDRKRKYSHSAADSVAATSKSITQNYNSDKSVKVKGTQPSKFFSCSLSIIEMLKLGKVNTRTSSAIKVFSFDMDHFAWSKVPELLVEFFEESKPFGCGGFRKAFKATSQTCMSCRAE